MPQAPVADSAPAPSPAARLYILLTGDDETRMCRDISDAACHEQPGNFVRHSVAAVGSKVGDELASARLVLPWVLGAVAAPAWMVGMLVPIREAGALLPQVFLGAWVRGLPIRKLAWALGALLQALAAVAMAALVLFGTGPLAGGLLLGALVVQSGARGLASVSSKDVLGKTIAKSRRGAVQGWAGSAASGVGLAVGIALSLFGVATDDGVPEVRVLALLLGGAALGWFVNSLAAGAVREERGATEGGESAWQAVRTGLRLLRDDRAFRAFNVARLLALSSALALPYLAVLAREQTGGTLRDLGVLVIASGIGGVVASPLWGRLADRSSHRVMALGAALVAVGCALAAAMPSLPPGIRDAVWPYAVLYAFLVVAHGGIRLGRKTYVIDLASAETRALYVALSNTLIGVAFLPAGALVGALANLLGSSLLLALLAATALLAALSSRGLTPVE